MMTYKSIQINKDLFELNIDDYHVDIFINGKLKKRIRKELNVEYWKYIIADYLITRCIKRIKK
jgi:hypothetical protein